MNCPCHWGKHKNYQFPLNFTEGNFTELGAPKSETATSMVYRNLEILVIFQLISLSVENLTLSDMATIHYNKSFPPVIEFLCFFFSFPPLPSLSFLSLFLSLSTFFLITVVWKLKNFHDNWLSTDHSDCFIQVNFMIKKNYSHKLKKKHYPDCKKFHMQQNKAQFNKTKKSVS